MMDLLGDILTGAILVAAAIAIVVGCVLMYVHSSDRVRAYIDRILGIVILIPVTLVGMLALSALGNAFLACVGAS